MVIDKESNKKFHLMFRLVTFNQVLNSIIITFGFTNKKRNQLIKNEINKLKIEKKKVPNLPI